MMLRSWHYIVQLSSNFMYLYATAKADVTRPGSTETRVVNYSYIISYYTYVLVYNKLVLKFWSFKNFSVEKIVRGDYNTAESKQSRSIMSWWFQDVGSSFWALLSCMCDKFNWYMSNLKLQDLAQLLLLVLPAARYQQLNWFASVATGSLSLLKGTDQVTSSQLPHDSQSRATCMCMHSIQSPPYQQWQHMHLDQPHFGPWPCVMWMIISCPTMPMAWEPLYHDSITDRCLRSWGGYIHRSQGRTWSSQKGQTPHPDGGK